MRGKICNFLEKIKIYTVVFLILLSVTMVFILIEFNKEKLSGFFEGIYPTESLYYQDNWYMSDNSGKTEPIKVPQVSEMELDADYYNVLPDHIDADSILAFSSMYQIVTVSVDDEIIYVRGEDKIHTFNVGTENGWNYVHIDSKYAGHTIKIHMNSSRYKSSCQLGNVLLGDRASVYVKLIFMNAGNFVLEILMVFLGIVLCVVGIVSWRAPKLRGKSFCLGLTSILLALWFHTGTVGMPLFILSNYTTRMFCFIAFLILPLSISRYYAYQFEEERRWSSSLNILYWISVLNWFYNLFMILFYSKDCIDLVKSIHVIYLSLGIIIAFKTCSFIIQRKSKNIIDKIESTSIFIVTFAMVGEIIMYYCGFKNKIGLLLRLVFVMYITALCLAILMELHRMIINYRDTKSQLTDATNKLMASQMQPHFISNSLGAITCLIDTDPDNAKNLISDLASYLRDNVRVLDSTDLIPVRSEIEHVKRYLRIEKARFEDRLNIVYSIECDTFRVPALSIQPLVENAVKHGICKKKDGGTLILRTYEDDTYYHIEVEDNGIGFDYDNYLNSHHDSYGMQNVSLRLKQQLNADINIDSHIGIGTIITIKINKNQKPSY